MCDTLLELFERVEQLEQPQQTLYLEAERWLTIPYQPLLTTGYLRLNYFRAYPCGFGSIIANYTGDFLRTLIQDEKARLRQRRYWFLLQMLSGHCNLGCIKANTPRQFQCKECKEYPKKLSKAKQSMVKQINGNGLCECHMRPEMCYCEEWGRQ